MARQPAELRGAIAAPVAAMVGSEVRNCGGGIAVMVCAGDELSCHCWGVPGEGAAPTRFDPATRSDQACGRRALAPNSPHSSSERRPYAGTSMRKRSTDSTEGGEEQPKGSPSPVI